MKATAERSCGVSFPAADQFSQTRQHGLAELRDALISVAALVAEADGRVDPVEHDLVAEVMEHNGLLTIFTATEITEAFRQGIRRIGAEGRKTALAELGRYAGSRAARLLVKTAEQIAAADGRIHPAEREVLELIHAALGRPERFKQHNRGRRGIR